MSSSSEAAPTAHRREYWVIFAWLTALTVLEVGVAYLEISKGLMVSALVLLALAKATLVALFYMHLKHETKIFRRTIFYCLGIPVFYAFVLIAEAGWRMLR
jgi:cytochrome c oxidase subunit IV